MYKKIFALLVAQLCVLGMYAQQRTISEMKRLAVQKLSGKDVSLLENRGKLYVYGNEDGFVIINRNDDSRPVVGYSKKKYDKNRLPEGLKWWLQVAEKTIQAKNDMMEPARNRASYSAVEPFILSTWDQEKPYYYLCPKDNGKYCMTGCVATTLAQVLYYYKYPATATGEGSYYLNDKTYNKTINTTYDWGNMKNSYKATDLRLSDPVQAVAALMRDCGYATNMTYSSDGSGTSDYYMALSLKNVFKYDSLAIRYYDRDCYADEEWKGLIYSALAKKMPIMYAGADEEGNNGHEFLLCGIDSDGLVYVNWGWGGDGDGFFDLDMLKYYGNEFNHLQSMVLGTKPQETPDSEDKYSSLWIADSVDYAVYDNDVLEMNLLYMFNYTVLDFNGTLDLTLVNKFDASDVTHLNLINTHEEESGTVGPFYGYYFINDKTEEQEPVYMNGFKDLSPGIYRMYLTSKEDRDSQRQTIRCPGGVQYATLKKLSDGQLLVSNKDVDDISTGVEIIRNQSRQNSNASIYRLDGSKTAIGNGLSKAIYVVNGKKVILP